MEFEQALRQRRNVSTWSDQVPPKSDILKISKVLHDFSPAKAGNPKYHLHIYRNDDEERKLQIYKATRTKTYEEDPTTEPRFNSQVLAPWLFIMSDLTDKKPSDPEIWINVGIATATIAYTAASMGLATGLCRCMTYGDELLTPLFGFRPVMLIGVGYDNGSDQYWCPVYNEYRKKVRREHKPEMDSYITELRLDVQV